MCFVWLNDGDYWQTVSYDLVFICVYTLQLGVGFWKISWF